MRILAAVTLLSLVFSSGGAAATDEEVRFSLSPSGALRVPVMINGRGPFTFLLDTGSSHTAVSRDLADRLEVPVVAQARVSTTAGVQMRLIGKLEHMAIGKASVEGLMPSLVSPSQLRGLEPGIEGLIGQDFLSAFNYTLDYRQKRLRWTAEHDGTSARLPLIRAGDRSLVQLSGDERHAPVWMVPDSGSEGFVIFERNGRTPLRVDPAAHLVGVSGLASGQTAHGGVLRELQVGAVTLRNQPAAVLEMGEGSRAVEGDGLMPLHGFSSVAFNNREAYMVVRR